MNKIKIIKVYKNSTIRLPHSLLKRLNIKENSHLVIEEKSYGFVLCKLEVYDTFLGQFEADMSKFDADIRDATNSVKSLFSALISKKEIKQIEKEKQNI